MWDLTLPKVVQRLAARFGRDIPAHKVVNDNIPARALHTQACFLTGMAETLYTSERVDASDQLWQWTCILHDTF